MSTQRTYHIASSQLTIDFGSVLDVPAEVVVSSDDYRLSMGGGVSAAIRMAAGNAVALDAAKAVPREAGDVVVTTAGALPARYVFHVVTMGPGYWDDPSRASAREVVGLVRRATRTCLGLMQPLGVRSIVFPALGTGTAGYPIEASAAAMADVVNDVLSQSSWQLNVSIMLMSRNFASPVQYVAFYEEFARRVPLVAAQETAQPPPVRADRPQAVVSDLLGLEQERQALEQQLIDLQQGSAFAPRSMSNQAAGRPPRCSSPMPTKMNSCATSSLTISVDCVPVATSQHGATARSFRVRNGRPRSSGGWTKPTSSSCS